MEKIHLYDKIISPIVTEINHFCAFDIVKFKKVIFTDTSIKELEKRHT